MLLSNSRMENFACMPCMLILSSRFPFAVSVPIEVLCVELDSSAAEDPTQCSGCGLDEEDVETLLLCDACPRAFCGTCVACSHGGGVQGRKQVELLFNTDDKWSCPFCKPPAPLQSLQTYMERIGEEEESKERTVETIISELEKVEAERKECEYQMSPRGIGGKEDRGWSRTAHEHEIGTHGGD